MLRVDFLTLIPAGLGKLISEAVKSFAEKTGVEADFWEQDLPLWSVSSLDTTTGILRRLEIGAYWVDEVPEVRIVPQVLRLDSKQNVMFAWGKISPESIIAVRVWDLSKGSGELEGYLYTAWSTARKMAPPDASTGVSIPRSPLHKEQS